MGGAALIAATKYDIVCVWRGDEGEGGVLVWMCVCVCGCDFVGGCRCD